MTQESINSAKGSTATTTSTTTSSTSNITTKVTPSSDNHEHLILSRLKSLVPECDTVKAAYEACFQDFFPKFLKGARFDPCKDKLKSYTSCLRQALGSMGIDMNEIDATRLDPDAIAAMFNKN